MPGEMNVPDIWPDWELSEELDSGTFGTVYCARSREDPQFLSAVKIIEIPQDEKHVEQLRTEGMTEEQIRRYYTRVMEQYVAEIRRMELLRGRSNIVSIEDCKTIPHKNGLGFSICIRMEKLKTLKEYLCDKHLQEKEVVRLGIDICHALEICHQNGILHLDVKPDNIFVNDRLPSEVVFKLGDFGVSRDYLKAHSDSVMQGTLLYMAPEVSRNEAAGCQADLYSLGLTLYRLMNCNRLPFLEEKQFPSHEDLKDATRMRLSGITLPEPKEASSAFSDVIRKACAYRPEDRYRNAIEMKKALTGLLRKKSDSSYTSGSWRRKSTLFLIIIFAVLAAFCAWGFWQGKENSKTKMADPSVPEATSIPMIVVIDRGGKAP